MRIEIKNVAVGVLAGIAVVIPFARAQAPAPAKSPNYALTCSTDADTSVKCSQARRLLLRQKDAYITQMHAQEAQTAYNTAMQALGEESRKIITENGWPANTQFNPNFSDPSVAFIAPPPPPLSLNPPPPASKGPKK